MTPPTISQSTSGADARHPPVATAVDALDARARIANLLDTGRTGAALEAIELLVEEIFCEPLNTAEIFADPFLDDACQRAGAASLRSLPGADAAAAEDPTPVVFVASRLQGSGGHTAVLADIARIANVRVKVLLTGVGGGTNLARLAHVFAGVREISFECAPRRDRGAKLRWLQQRLRALRPQTVWLFNHHQDSVAVAGVQPGQGYALKYLHHGDHHLCLGVCLPFGEHYDPHAMGWHNCRHELGRNDNRYLPMAVDRPVTPPSARSGPLVTCTAAGRNKIEHAYWPSYAEVIPALLARTGGSHVHFGRLSPLYLWRLRRALARHGVAPGAFRYIPHVTSVAEGLLKEQVDLYLSSFPYPGARTLVEAMAAGVPIAAHDHSGSAFLGALHMMPAGSFVWSRPEELLAFAARTTRPALRRMGELARRHFENYHTPEAMHAALQPGAPAAPVPPAQFSHRPDPLAQALHRAREFSLLALVERWVIRTVRRVRSTFS